MCTRYVRYMYLLYTLYIALQNWSTINTAVCSLLDPDASTPSNIFQPRALSSTHIQLDDMSQHPQQNVRYVPLATEDDATKQNGKHIVIDDDDDDDNVDHSNNHQHQQRSFANPRRSTSGAVGGLAVGAGGADR